uniref:Uncharacterized protein n=1 Tax=Ralstonia solanacearum TaxID=305 RepID=A0A0S4WNJ4_RALSL|nr:protein of unknown function [Ralstonia solanacearum]
MRCERGHHEHRQHRSKTSLGGICQTIAVDLPVLPHNGSRQWSCPRTCLLYTSPSPRD